VRKADHIDTAGEDTTHIQISKKVFYEFKVIGTYGEEQSRTYSNLFDRLLQHRGKLGIGDRKVREEDTLRQQE